MKKGNRSKIILDLCGGTGSWSKPYKRAGYRVILITLPDYRVDAIEFQNERMWFIHQKADSRKHIKVNYKDVYGILAAPPCTMFSLARTKAKALRDLSKGMECVRACLEIIWRCMEISQDTRHKTVPLKFWALENPNGMLKYFLGKPAFEFSPYEFGDGYKKRTHLWGWFNEPKKKVGKVVADKAFKLLNPKRLKKFDTLASREIAPEMFGKLTRQERRAITPANFARAFFKANK